MVPTILAETISYTKRVAAVALLDMRKAFELVRHYILATQADLFGFNPSALAYLLSIYRAPRCITVGKVATTFATVECSIVAEYDVCWAECFVFRFNDGEFFAIGFVCSGL